MEDRLKDNKNKANICKAQGSAIFYVRSMVKQENKRKQKEIKNASSQN